MKYVLILAVLAVVIVVGLTACTEEECIEWQDWGNPECVPFSPLPAPEPVKICLPELKQDCDWTGCTYELVYDCQF